MNEAQHRADRAAHVLDRRRKNNRASLLSGGITVVRLRTDEVTDSGAAWGGLKVRARCAQVRL